MKRLALIVASVVTFALSAFAQTPAGFQTKINASVDDHAYLPAIETLREFRNRDRKIFEANNYDYLLGRLAEKSGDFALAMSSYQSMVSRGSILVPYAKWHLSQIARATGNLMLERVYLQELIADSPGILLSSAVKNRLIRSFSESRNYIEAIKLLTTPPSSTIKVTPPSGQRIADNGLARENLVLLADADLNSNRLNEARDTYNKLLNEMPNPAQPDDFALAAAKGLDLLDVGGENFGKEVAKLADTEHLRRASIYQFNRDFNDARLHYKAIIENYPESGIVPDAVFQIGRGYMQQGEFVDAVQWFERIQEQFPDHPVAKDALMQAASCYSKTAKYKEAVARYRKFIERYTDDERLDRAYLNIVDVYRDEGEEQDSLQWAIATAQVFKGKPSEAIAVFTQARIYLAGGDSANALAALDRLKTYPDLGGIKAPGGTNVAEVAFLRGYALEKLQRYDEAIEAYLSVPDGRSEYYGGRATERLLILSGLDNAKNSIVRKTAILSADARSKDAETSRKALQSLLRITDVREEREKLLNSLQGVYKTLPAYQGLPSFKMAEVGRREMLKEEVASSGENEHKRIADELLFLGLYDEAAPELEASQSSADAGKSGDNGYTLAVLYQRGDMANRSVAFIEPLWRNVPADYQIELIPRDQLEMLYPTPYVDSLLKYAPQRDVDPRYVLSIMRQESRYRAQVKSYAAARGLMQFVSGTSDKIAGELRRPSFQQDELYDPSTSILFGSQYLSDLFQEFPNQPAAVAASYNGGDDNMKRWLARSKSDLPDRYVPEIIFSQSKDYVYKVMANFRMYQSIYDENLRPK
jgi:soluble lytic murein transglycosylase